MYLNGYVGKWNATNANELICWMVSIRRSNFVSFRTLFVQTLYLWKRFESIYSDAKTPKTSITSNYVVCSEDSSKIHISFVTRNLDWNWSVGAVPEQISVRLGESFSLVPFNVRLLIRTEYWQETDGWYQPHLPKLNFTNLLSVLFNRIRNSKSKNGQNYGCKSNAVR